MDITLKNPGALKRLRRDGPAFWPMRRPSWDDPPLWSQPLTQTAITVVPSGSAWTPVITVPGIIGYMAIVQSYVLTPLGSAALANLALRVLANGRLINGFSLLGNAEYNRPNGAAAFPTRGRATFLSAVNANESIQFQVQNNGIFQQTVLSAMYGYYANVVDQAERTDTMGLTDA